MLPAAMTALLRATDPVSSSGTPPPVGPLPVGPPPGVAPRPAPAWYTGRTMVGSMTGRITVASGSYRRTTVASGSYPSFPPRPYPPPLQVTQQPYRSSDELVLH